MNDIQETDKELLSWNNQFVSWLENNWIHEDKAHDIHHLHRVWRNCQKINSGEGGKADLLVLLAASYFHDLVTLPKNHADRRKSSWYSAQKTAELLTHTFENFPTDKIPAIHHAIHAHSFSAYIEIETLEASIVQDADRLEALGAVGIARLFYTAAKMNAELYHINDPLGKNRIFDDKKYALDHIEVKLLQLPNSMKTFTGKKLAEKEAGFIHMFRDKFLSEITP